MDLYHAPIRYCHNCPDSESLRILYYQATVAQKQHRMLEIRTRNF
ncbi:hypothetical protein MtrunA17_Chr8g0343531 [Medicago truncatula]|uniref:Uncharacterized protein n=1 Tax=Medicago truncatula TaxID=3880 RepID=A0A396GD81_MEDTR|nr:hypothetical protein MtrunA17_Chr8g0343531 [Medicago truncatula]